MNIKSVLPRDAIPSIDDPSFGTAYSGAEADDVFVVEGEPTRGYPIRILNYHEVVNDVVDGQPLAITWCPICGSAVVYEAVVDGQPLTFGVSGKLADDDLVLYDRQTESEWKQSTGRCIAGELDGQSLTVVPAPMISVAAFRESYPDGVLLQPQSGGSAAGRDYDSTPYEAYTDGDGFGLGPMRGSGPSREWDRDDLDPKTVVLGIERDGEAVGFPLPAIESAGGVIESKVGDHHIVVIATDDGLHAFEGPGFDLTLAADGQLRGDGAVWTPATGESDDGRHLTRVPARRLFAFAWQDDHGPAAFYIDESAE
mgnify:CR=1 FL=1